jgi:uncharacterized membrane protein
MDVSGLLLLLIGGSVIIAAFLLFLPTPTSRTRGEASADRSDSGALVRDDDRFWYGGLLYCNQDDPDLLVPKRYGWGWTVNFAHPAAKFILFGVVVLLLLPVVLPLLGVHLTAAGCHPSGCTSVP